MARRAPKRGGAAVKGAPSAPVRRALLWATPASADLARRVAEGAGLTPIAAGGTGVARTFAESIGATPFDDLRHALHTSDAEAALLAAGGGAEWALLSDAEFLRACAARGLRIITLAPYPTSVRAAARADASAPASPVFAPLFRRSPGAIAAAEAVGMFGQVTTLDLSCRSGGGQGSLAARLYDAMDFALALLGAPETIDASVRGPRAESGLRLAAGDSLRDLRGDMTLHLRYADGRSAAIMLSDRAGRWFRGATLLGESGCVRVDDGAFEWVDGAGRLVDTSVRRAPARRAPKDDDPDEGAVAAMVGDVSRLLDPRTPPAAPTDYLWALSMSEAALLSARTGQPESPSTIQRMAGSI